MQYLCLPRHKAYRSGGLRMNIPNISDAEFRLCLFVWELEPVFSGELVKRCANSYGWARSTTHTLIRRLMDRGVLKNSNGIVTSLISKEQVQAAALRNLIEKRFDNSVSSLRDALDRQEEL